MFFFKKKTCLVKNRLKDLKYSMFRQFITYLSINIKKIWRFESYRILASLKSFKAEC